MRTREKKAQENDGECFRAQFLWPLLCEMYKISEERVIAHLYWSAHTEMVVLMFYLRTQFMSAIWRHIFQYLSWHRRTLSSESIFLFHFLWFDSEQWTLDSIYSISSLVRCKFSSYAFFLFAFLFILCYSMSLYAWHHYLDSLFFVFVLFLFYYYSIRNAIDNRKKLEGTDENFIGICELWMCSNNSVKHWMNGCEWDMRVCRLCK